jgi:hypothetical protein
MIREQARNVPVIPDGRPKMSHERAAVGDDRFPGNSANQGLVAATEAQKLRTGSISA